MPTKEALHRFIARVESNDHVEAVLEFYAMECVIRENHSEPRYGRDLQVARERAILARAATVKSRCVYVIFHSGDDVAIRWIFEFHWPDFTVTRMDEIALQRWEGERIVEEIFIYDPRQRIPQAATASTALPA